MGSHLSSKLPLSSASSFSVSIQPGITAFTLKSSLIYLDYPMLFRYYACVSVNIFTKNLFKFSKLFILWVIDLELSEAIMKRASVRMFKEDPIDDKIIEELIEAAIRAPTASALENWIFCVIKDEDARKKVFEAIKEGHTFYYKLRGLPEEKLKKLEEKINAGMYWGSVRRDFSWKDV